MGKRREIRVKAVGKPTRGMFKGELMPKEWHLGIRAYEHLSRPDAHSPRCPDAVVGRSMPRSGVE